MHLTPNCINGHENGIPKYGVPAVDHRCSDEEGRLKVKYGNELYDRLGETVKVWLLYNCFNLDTWLSTHGRIFQPVRFISAYKGQVCMFVWDIISTYGRTTRNSSIFLNRPLPWCNQPGNNNRDLIIKEEV